MLRKLDESPIFIHIPNTISADLRYEAGRDRNDLAKFDARVSGFRSRGPRVPASFETELAKVRVRFDRAEVSYLTVLAARIEAVLVSTHFGHYLWLFRDALYQTKHRLEPLEATALLLEAENRVKARIARAIALMEQVQVIESPGRPPLPDDVKVLVWHRDKGRCVKCGSNQNLEFDHIIPFSMGGATTFRNLQLLCEPCNRAKSSSLI